MDGKVKHKVIENLGYLEDYLDIFDDPVAHFQQIAKEWNARQHMPDTIEVKLSDKLPDQCSNRFLFPSSKKNAFDTKDRFFDSFNFSLDDVYRALGYFSRYSQEFQQHLHAMLSDKEIRDIYKGLWEIEDSFKIIKSEFKTRPVFVSTEDHIQGHFFICFAALVVMRVLEQFIGKCHSVKQIRNFLASYSCSYLDQNYYLFDYRDDVILTMKKTFGLDLSKKIMPLSEIKSICMYKDMKI